MKALRVFFWALLLIIEVGALDESYPFEMLHFYSVYKMEWAVLTKDKRTIATGCKHKPLSAEALEKAPPDIQAFEAAAAAAGISGICSFDEFIKEVANRAISLSWSRSEKGSPKPPVTPLNILDQSNPVDLIDGIQQRFNKQKTTVLLYWPSKLIPSRKFPEPAGGGGIKEVPLPILQRLILNAAQRSRQAAALLDPNSVKAKTVDACNEEGKKYLRIAKQIRQRDQWEYLEPAIRGSDAAKPFGTLVDKPVIINSVDDKTQLKIYEKPTKGDNKGIITTESGTLREFDQDAIFASASDSVTQAQKDAFTNAIRVYGTTIRDDDPEKAKNDKNAKVHKDVMDAMQQHIDLVDSPNTACEPEIPIPKRSKQR